MTRSTAELADKGNSHGIKDLSGKFGFFLPSEKMCVFGYEAVSPILTPSTLKGYRQESVPVTASVRQ